MPLWNFSLSMLCRNENADTAVSPGIARWQQDILSEHAGRLTKRKAGSTGVAVGVGDGDGVPCMFRHFSADL